MNAIKLLSGWKIEPVLSREWQKGKVWRMYVSNHKGQVSVYLDTGDVLGSVGQAYYEFYPNAQGEAERFLLGEEDKLVRRLKIALNSKAAQNFKKGIYY